MLQRSRAHADHPLSFFHTGDLKTLRDDPQAAGIDVRAELLAFHKKFYAARGMTLCVVGREDLDTLQRWVVDKFGAIDDHVCLYCDVFQLHCLTKNLCFNFWELF